MRLAFIVFGILIARSNAGSKKVVNPLLLEFELDAVSGTFKAQNLRDTLITEMNEIVGQVNQNISQHVIALSKRYEEALIEVIATAKDSGLNTISALVVGVQKIISDLGLVKTKLITGVSNVLNTLIGTITSDINQRIQTLNIKIKTGALKLQCFTDKIPDINSNITEFVAEAQNTLQNGITNIQTTLASNSATFQTLIGQMNTDLKTGNIPVVI